jgi:hypothetical protein
MARHEPLWPTTKKLKMDIDINSIINLFVENFVIKSLQRESATLLKDKKERAKFTHRLNEKWETVLDMKRLSKIPLGAREKEYATNVLDVEDFEMWYIVSSNGPIDGQIAEFKVALDKVYGRGFGSVIVNQSGSKLYFEAAVTRGKQNRFVGKK